jgi:opacity protein-like surface antigen
VAKGTSTLLACNNLTSTDCNANINYLSAGGYARFNLTKSRFQAWVAAGGTGKFPISKTTTALRSDDIKMTMTFALGGGFDYYLSNKTFIPASLEYQLFQSSETVSANIILIRAGYGWAF